MQQLAKLRTLDVWDTLIRRNCHPECIKLAVAQHVWLRFADRLHKPGTEAWGLYLERLEVERVLATAARSGDLDDEYALEEVIADWIGRILDIPSTERTDLTDELVALEFRFECERSFPDPDITKFLAVHPSEKTIFLSDFYMGAEMLTKLLEYHGLTSLVESGLSSCDVGINKRSGKLFSHVHKIFGIAPSDHVHVGDNAHSDVQMPKQLGIKAVHFIPAENHQKRRLREQLFSARSELFLHLHEKSLSKAKAHLNEMLVQSEGAFLTGVRTAPLFIGFAQFIAESCLRDKVGHVYFQTREGEFFLRVFNALFPENQYAGMTLPTASLLEVSRLSTFSASLKDISIEELRRVWRLVQRQSMAALLKTLGMPAEDVWPMLQRHGLSLDEIIERPWEHTGVRSLLDDTEFKQSLQEKVQHDRIMIMRYLEQQGVTKTNRIAVVDIGWRGTIQDNLATLTPDVPYFGYYLGLQRFLNPQLRNVTKAAYGPDANREHQWIALLDAVSPIEMLCNSPEGSVEGYVNAEDTVIARRRVDDAENRAFACFAKEFQAGVIFAANVWRPYLANYAVSSVELRETAMKIWETLSEDSPEELVQACLGAPQNDIFGFGDFFDKSDIPSVSEICRGIFLHNHRQRVIQYIKRTQWPSAIRHRKDISPGHRYLLLALVGLARNYKHLRIKLQQTRSHEAD